MNKNINYYEVLNVNFNFTDKEIKTSYRSLSKIHHPDKNNGDNKGFNLLAEAYKVLTTDERKKYDKESKYGANYDPSLSLLDFEFSNTNVSSDKVYDKMRDFKKSEMIHVVLEIPKFQENIKYTRNIICSKCEGKGNTSINNLNLKGKMGSLFDGEEILCDICDGTGNFTGYDCPGCKGEGYIKLGLSKCDKCKGVGVIEKEKRIKIKEEDFKDGKYMIQYYGNQSKYNGVTGNLYIIITG